MLEVLLHGAAGAFPYRARSGKQEPGVLVCEGILLGVIEELGRPSSIIKPKRRQSSSVTQSRPADESGQHLPHLEASPPSIQVDKIPEAMWRTLVIDRKDGSLDSYPPLEYKIDFEWLCRQAVKDPQALNSDVLYWFQGNASIIFKDHPEKQLIQNRLSLLLSQGHYQQRRDVMNFTRQMLNVWVNMKKVLAVLDDGKLGMAPKRARVRDQVWILAGLTTTSCGGNEWSTVYLGVFKLITEDINMSNNTGRSSTSIERLVGGE
ncbi:hypothetical protein GGR51DRAFT_554853 [Nemania sp. FL0031]|nr:hypothetical protein GGR51DRAFT_554853 [Nemania sp. FL0031]